MKYIINSEKENNALIPDKWVVGTGLSTNSIYITHTDAPLMIVQYALDSEKSETPCTVYIRGSVNPQTISRLFNEAWELLNIYKDRFSRLKTQEEDFPKNII